VTNYYEYYGPDNRWLGEPYDYVLDRFVEYNIIFSDNNSSVTEIVAYYEGERVEALAGIYQQDGRINWIEYIYNSSASFVYGDLYTVEEANEYETKFLSGEISYYEYNEWMFKDQDIIYGSADGGSLRTWTHGGDDIINLYSGDSNYVDAGYGNDVILNWNTYSNGLYYGADGDDFFSIANGQIWGGSGNDMFHIVPIWDENAIYEYAEILDYEIGVDSIYAEGSVSYAASEKGIWLAVGDAETSMLIADVFDINQLTIVDNLG